MKMRLTSSPLLAYRSDGTFTASPMEDVLPTRTVEVATLADCETYRQAWIADVKATGRAAVITAHKAHFCKTRKIRGFDQWSDGQVLVNAELVKEG